MKMLRLALDDLHMTLGYDDFGAGQARLAELAEARPEYVKFDRQLISGIDRPGRHRRQVVESLVEMCKQLGIVTLSEGVETASEAAACRDLGFELMQGYFCGRPAGAKITTGAAMSAEDESELLASLQPPVEAAAAR